MLTALAFYLLATGRWGSYVGLPGRSVYVSDLVVGVAVASTLTAFLRDRSRWPAWMAAIRRAPFLLSVVSLVLLIAAVRLLAGGDLSRVALRDFAPYGYGVVALLLLRERSSVWERRPLLVFLPSVVLSTWLMFDLFVVSHLGAMPSVGNDVLFAPRPDVNATICGVTVAMVVLVLQRGSSTRLVRAGLVALAGVDIYLVLRLPSRAALIASTLALCLALSRIAVKAWHRGWLPRAAMVTMALAAIGIVAFSVPGQRLIDSALSEGQAAGTTHARAEAWKHVVDYVDAKPERVAVGVGFGPDFLHASGAARYYEGVYENVRSPHDYLLGSFARMGLVGAIPILIMLLLGLAAGARMVIAPDAEAIDSLAGLLLVTLPIIASLGVVLESPFGAIPYFWAVGRYARYVLRRRARSPSEPSSVVDARLPTTSRATP